MKLLATMLAAYALATHCAGVGAAGGDPVAGKVKAEEVCASCHGLDGNKPIAPAYPRLAGQYADYMEQALEAYKTGERRNALMAPFAAQLSAEDRKNVSAWYASQEDGVHTVGK